VASKGPADPLRDQGMAAVAETREMMLKAFPEAGDPTGPPPQWLGDLVDRMIVGATFCEHIRRRRTQPSFAAVWEKHWRCRRCVAEYGEAGLAGAHPTLGPIEEFTCDFCRTYRGPGGLIPAVLRLDLWVVIGGACDPCVNVLSRSGGATVIE
jgi:hypothetical protein